MFWKPEFSGRPSTPDSDPEIIADLQSKVVDNIYGQSVLSLLSSVVSIFNEVAQEEGGLLRDSETMAYLRDANIDFIISDTIHVQYFLPYTLNVPFAYFGIAYHSWAAKEPFLPSYVPNTMSPFTDELQ